jgi:hypothetical protein
MSSTPPIPTAPISMPTPKATDNSQTRSGGGMDVNMMAGAQLQHSAADLLAPLPALGPGYFFQPMRSLNLPELVPFHEDGVSLPG